MTDEEIGNAIFGSIFEKIPRINFITNRTYKEVVFNIALNFINTIDYCSKLAYYKCHFKRSITWVL